MEYKRITLKLTPREYLLLNTYLLWIQEQTGQYKTKQQALYELLHPVLQLVDECYTIQDGT